jgi:hypothetical protein
MHDTTPLSITTLQGMASKVSLSGVVVVFEAPGTLPLPADEHALPEADTEADAEAESTALVTREQERVQVELIPRAYTLGIELAW